MDCGDWRLFLCEDVDTGTSVAGVYLVLVAVVEGTAGLGSP